MRDIVKKKYCTGCKACYNACPKDAINIVIDEEGFWYPKINIDKCISCHLCSKVCPSLKVLKKPSQIADIKVYAAYSLKEETRIKSTSGGIFFELASNVIDNGGYVVGAVYDENHHVKHHIASDKEELIKLRQSKYVQSDSCNIYEKTKLLLEEDNLVMFCGTPCQIAAITCFLGKGYEKLILCDFICRGVASPKVYEAYLEMLRIRYKSKIKQITFKNKTYGWNRFSTLVEFENGEEYIQDRYHDLYIVGYLQTNLFCRPSCYQCKYKEIPHVSDITLADFWGISKTRPHLDQEKGTSLVLINSEKGKKLFEKIKVNLISESCSLEEAINGDDSMLNSIEKNHSRKKFYKDLNKLPFEDLIEKYSKINTFSYAFSKIKSLARRVYSAGDKVE